MQIFTRSSSKNSEIFSDSSLSNKTICITSIHPVSECSCLFKARLLKRPLHSDWSALTGLSSRGACYTAGVFATSAMSGGGGVWTVVTSQLYRSPDGLFEGTVPESGMYALLHGLRVLIGKQYLQSIPCLINKKKNKSNFLQYDTF